MRLLPPQHEGLHEAFPPPDRILKQPYAGVLHHNASKGSALGLVPLAIGAAFRLPRVRAFGFEIGAYGTLIWAAHALYERYSQDQLSTIFLRFQDIDVPQQKVYDRLTKWDTDNYWLVGAAVGIGLVARSPRPWSGPAWKRFLTAGALGGTVGSYSFRTLAALDAFRDPKARQRAEEVMKEQTGWSVTISKVLLKAQEGQAILAGVRIPDVPYISDHWFDTAFTSKPGVGPRVDRFKFGNAGISWPNESDEPHLTMNTGWADDPEPYANTNYLWNGTVPQLHAYIDKLQTRRQRYAQEAEMLWQWVAKKEAEMYSLPMGPMGESEERLAARRAAEIIGCMHTKVWDAVSHCDWMIADARKRVQQLQHASGRRIEERTAKPSSTSIDVQSAKPELSLPGFRAELNGCVHQQQRCQAERQSFDLLIPQLVKSAVELNNKSQANESAKGKEEAMVREITKSIVKEQEAALDAATFDVKIMRKIVEDAEQLPKGL